MTQTTLPERAAPPGALDQELRTFAAEKPRLLAGAPGKWALVKVDQVLDIFETQADAIRQGYHRLGPVPFLVKQIQEVELPLEFTSSLLDL